MQPLHRRSISRPLSRAIGVGLALGLLASAAPALAAPAKVAVARVKGPGRAAPLKFATGLRAGLRAAGVTVMEVGPASPGKAGFLDEAKEAGADYLVVVKLRYARKKRFATATLFDVASGEEVDSNKGTYRTKSRAGKAGARMGEAIGKVAAQAFASRTPEPVKPVVAAPPPAPAATPAPTPKEEAKPAATARRDEGSGLDLGGKEGAVFRLSVGAGTQVGSAYTVAVGGEVTGLAYTLSPLFLTQVEVSVLAPTIGLGGELWLSYVPVKYQVDVSPPVDPREPSGRFFNVGGAVKYRLALAEIGETGGLFLTPLLGVGYDSMTAEGQGDNTVVVSYSTVNLQGGLRFGVALSEDLNVNLETRVGGVLVYDEGPTTTGEGGKGFNLRIGGGARYWINDIFGAFVNLGYSYQRIGLKGLATRVAFEGDPQLLDATVFNGDFKISTGVQVAL